MTTPNLNKIDDDWDLKEGFINVKIVVPDFYCGISLSNNNNHYTCPICNISNIEKVVMDESEEDDDYSPPEIDSEGRKHYHDYNYNNKMAYITCINKHMSYVPYKYTCEYGCHLKK